MIAAVFANGRVKDSDWLRRQIEGVGLVVCADGGTYHALKLGRMPDVVIGDIDSLSDEVRSALTAWGTRFVLHGVRKDETDAELALRYCVERGTERILFIGALGGRLDHALANVLLLAAEEFRSVPIVLLDDRTKVTLCRNWCQLSGSPGDIVSLLPWGGDVRGVWTEGLEYPLREETLSFGLARGVSNIMLGDAASVGLESGLLLIVHRMGPFGSEGGLCDDGS